ncbi:hypothetical protein O6H91_17G040800 [Diphasiastrum complanatum]|uniref:Uncharacterized protein n=1 Tax=Diphasiastrum complanatum TaxID=34168 RepID=A0ACC2B614_DIPCM|nr:hypothetical protein O6H91_17G040800 [Diphasiastrum complanatum]
MGCTLSRTQDENRVEQVLAHLGDTFVFVPGLRLPKSVKLNTALGGFMSNELLERFAILRARIITVSARGYFPAKSVKRKKQTHGRMNVLALQKALEDYLPLLQGLTEQVEFAWNNQEDEKEETVLPSANYELLSVLHLLGMLLMLEANRTLTPKSPEAGHPAKVSEEDKKEAIETLLKSARVLERAITIIDCEDPELKTELPMDLQIAVLKALQMQALGQVVEIQLGFAIENVSATLAVKRRLACEEVGYWQQALDNLTEVNLSDYWGKKHVLYLKWKSAEAKAAAYYYHGLILDERNEEKEHANATCSLKAAKRLLKDSLKLREEFSAAAPPTRAPPLWGAAKYLGEKIPRDSHRRSFGTEDVHGLHKNSTRTPELPNFALSLKAEVYELPPIDEAWLFETAAKFDQQSVDERPQDKLGSKINKPLPTEDAWLRETASKFEQSMDERTRNKSRSKMNP